MPQVSLYIDQETLEKIEKKRKGTSYIHIQIGWRNHKEFFKR